MLSPEEIRKGVVEVVSKDTYINNKEVPGGLFDPRMGVLGHGTVCPTDGLTHINTPGYFGYIELARPVFFIQHIKDIMSILKCVCFKCSKLLISKDDHKHIANLKAMARWDYVYSKCSGINRCGEATEQGCGCKQPDKIKLEEMATIVAIWDNLEKAEDASPEEIAAIREAGKTQFTMRFTAEIVLKIFKRISDEDVQFMGFSPIWSRPDWMVCQVLPVAPPSVRPSVKQDANQRSEDDLTHIYGHIIKTNKDLEDRIQNNAAPHVIDGLTKILQYFIAMIANNKVKGAVPMAQRSGRPLQCITDRLNSKNGRIRGNLMGKRVDFSARSVITGDPNLSAKQLGVPKKVAMNLTKPVVVNDRNRNFLTMLVQNGPDVYPGAKNYEKKNGDTISLRNRDRMSIRLENGDIVHRHMMDGDPVLFNRQPSLHRMSMMCHIAKIMEKGDTFRMNVCDTKPYNADFDGDEMNMHMPQNVLSETELRHLAAIPYQIISPSSNSPLIGIYQDSMLGTYRFTRPDVEFSPREAMNILMGYSRVDVSKLVGKNRITNFDILSQITPPLTLKTKTKQYDDKVDDYATSNNVLEIFNGKYVRGQMIASTVKGVLSRVCNDFGNMACSDYIDDLQQVITEYMKTSAYSVGVSDLISDRKTTEEILQVIAAKKTEVQQLTDKMHLGIFENKTGNNNAIEYENQVKGILNKATDQTGAIAKKSLSATNRFLIMVASGSKGNMVNISQMISCLGQQSVDGKRVPYGFDSRTLPHFSKYDDSPGARGFVENSYISGLTAPELFFHAMGGRMGLIDTAVKTSQTGYIQRRLVKGLEDLKVEYDMTVRNNMGKIVQFSYGEDSADPTRIENQSIPIVNMSVEDIYMHYDIVGMTEGEHDLIKIYTKGAATRVRRQRDEARTYCKKYIDYMLETRDQLVANVFKFKNEDSVKTPVSFHNLILNVQGQLGLNANSTVDITPLEAFQMIDAKYETLKLSSFCKPNKLFEVLYYYYLSPKDLLVNKRFNAKAIELLLESVHLNYKKSIVSPGEMVGVIAGQSIGEPTTQMSLTRNECVKIMKVEKGSVLLTSTKIGDFCDQIISENPELTFNTGHENSVETVLGTSDAEYYIMSVGEDETTKWSKISHVSRHPVNGELMRVKTKSGRMVETTTSHSHLVRQDNKVQPIVGRDMRVGMRIPVSKNINNGNLINETVKVGNKTFVLDELFGWFIGAYLAEGSINYNTICITNVSTAFIQNTIEFAARFGKECKIYEKESEYGHTTDVKFTCAELADLLKISCGNGSFNKSVPDFAFVAPDAFKARLIQAYIDGDGNIQCDEKHHMIRACSRSLQLIKDVALLINYFGMFGSIHSTQTRGSELHHLSISAKYAQLYKTNIGSSLESKMVALNGLVEYLNRDDAHNVSDEIDKINGLGHIIAHCGKTLELEGQSRIYGRWARSGMSIGRRTLQKYIAEFESSPKAPSIAEELRILKQAADADVVWDEIVEIDVWTPEQSEMVYDFTVPGNQTFLTDYGVYVHNTLNTFHLAGVASKSNVTRGVPRIEEILRLTRNPDKPSVTVYLRPQDQHDKDKATNYCNMLQHTKLIDVVKSVEICFDPNDHATKIHSDQTLIDQFYLFDKMATECNDNYSTQQPRSKWIIRIEIDAESLLEKNITMDDIHFAVSTVHGSEVSCVYSDMNSSNLVFRIRLNSSVFNRGKKKGATVHAESLDQTDEIYLLKNFQDSILNNIVLRGVNRIVNVNPRIVKDMVVKEDGKYARKEAWVLDTTGSNLMDIFAMDFIDYTRTYSNDIREMYNILGIEAARQNILNEIVDVMEASDAYVNYHHLSILCDRMTVSKDLVPIYRSGILNDDIGPISKSTYEMHTEMFLQASRHGEFDQMRGVSANVMCGQQGYYGTNAFGLLLDMEAVMNMEDRDVDRKDVNDRIEELFGTIGKTDECSINRIRLDNNVHNLKNANTGVCEDDGYEVF
jgi:DNA-directed RNA polymerase beta' subunit